MHIKMYPNNLINHCKMMNINFQFDTYVPKWWCISVQPHENYFIVMSLMTCDGEITLRLLFVTITFSD